MGSAGDTRAKQGWYLVFGGDPKFWNFFGGPKLDPKFWGGPKIILGGSPSSGYVGKYSPQSCFVVTLGNIVFIRVPWILWKRFNISRVTMKHDCICQYPKSFWVGPQNTQNILGWQNPKTNTIAAPPTNPFLAGSLRTTMYHRPLRSRQLPPPSRVPG